MSGFEYHKKEIAQMNQTKKMEPRFCKNCGCELVSTSKHELCDNCRRKRNGTIRDGAIGIASSLLGIAFLIITNGKHGGKS